MDSKIEDYNYSVKDVIAVLTESKNPNRYWSDLKRKHKFRIYYESLSEKK